MIHRPKEFNLRVERIVPRGLLILVVVVRVDKIVVIIILVFAIDRLIVVRVVVIVRVVVVVVRVVVVVVIILILAIDRLVIVRVVNRFDAVFGHGVGGLRVLVRVRPRHFVPVLLGIVHARLEKKAHVESLSFKRNLLAAHGAVDDGLLDISLGDPFFDARVMKDVPARKNTGVGGARAGDLSRG